LEHSTGVVSNRKSPESPFNPATTAALPPVKPYRMARNDPKLPWIDEELVRDHGKLVREHGKLVCDHGKLVREHEELVCGHEELVCGHEELVCGHEKMVRKGAGTA
jgi:hypothetical protein